MLAQIDYIKPGTRVCFMQDNRVLNGIVLSTEVIISDNGTTIERFYTIEHESRNSWDPKIKTKVNDDIVAESRQQLLEKI